MTKDRSIYFSSFVSFFFGLTLATVSKTAWSTQQCKEYTLSKCYKPKYVLEKESQKRMLSFQAINHHRELYRYISK